MSPETAHAVHSTPYSYLDFPTEIRLEIYRYLMVQSEPIESDVWARYPLLGKMSHTPRYTSLRFRELSGQFLRVCQRIHHEASAVLYGENRFWLYCYKPPMSATTPTWPPVAPRYSVLLADVVLHLETDQNGPILPSEFHSHHLHRALETASFKQFNLELHKSSSWTHAALETPGSRGQRWGVLSKLLESIGVAKIMTSFMGFDIDGFVELQSFQEDELPRHLMRVQQQLLIKPWWA